MNSNVATLAGCCVPVNSDYQLRSEFAKFRVSFSQQTSMTVSYLGSQTMSDLNGLENYAYPTTFAPAAGYAGPFTPGQDVSCCQNDQFPQFLDLNTNNLWQAELRSAVGSNTVLFQAYTGSVHDLLYSGGSNGTTTYSLPLYGSVLLGAAPGTRTYFNGQTATVAAPNTLNTYDRADKVGGYSFELDHPVENNLLSLSYDSSKTSSYFGGINNLGSALYVPAGSWQAESTLQGHAQFAVTPRINATLSDYYFLYTNHSTQDSGLTFANHTHAFDGARLGLTWQPNRDVSVRLGTGSSIAPPYLSLVSTAQAPPSQIITAHQRTGPSRRTAPTSSRRLVLVTILAPISVLEIMSPLRSMSTSPICTTSFCKRKRVRERTPAFVVDFQWRIHCRCTESHRRTSGHRATKAWNSL